VVDADKTTTPTSNEVDNSQYQAGISLGDKVVLCFADTSKRLSVRMFEDGEDLDKGRLSIHSILGKAVSKSEEGDELELVDGTQTRKIMIESVERSLTLETVSNEPVREPSVDDGLTAAAVG
jgi:transcription elongation GreA/GreB family factor